MTAHVKKGEIFKLRMDDVTTGLMERARAFVNLDKSKFVRECIRERSEAIIAEHEKTRFTQEDWIRFFELVDHPPEPTARMRKAAQKYKDITAPDGV